MSKTTTASTAMTQTNEDDGIDLATYSTMTDADLDATSVAVEGLDVVDKATLIGKKFWIVDARINEKGKFGNFVSLKCMLASDRTVVVINDGSTGIYQQLQQLAERNGGQLPLPIRCSKGLRKSDYQNEFGSATTYYLTH